MTPQRPALAEVLAALTGCDRLNGDAARVGRVVSDGLSVRMRNVETGDEFTGVVPWAHASPAEAVEALATVGLWPWEIGDERAPRWWCEFLNDAIIDDPPSHAALVAVASLGRPLLQRITHTLVPWIARAAGCPDARVVWRVMSMDGLREHRDRQRVRGSDEWIVDAFSTEMGHAADRNGESAWPRECPWPALRPTHRVRRAWPALRTLAVGDGATPQPTGVHLVGLSRDRITLAVEAI